jgi:hypothetical protein
VGIRLADPSRPERPKLLGHVTLKYNMPDAVNPRSFVGKTGQKYTFASGERSIQTVRIEDAQYMLGRWPEIFTQIS